MNSFRELTETEALEEDYYRVFLIIKWGFCESRDPVAALELIKFQLNYLKKGWRRDV